MYGARPRRDPYGQRDRHTEIGFGVDVLDTEEAYVLRYQINGGQRTGAIEKRLSHTVNDKTDTFRIFK